MIRLNKLCARLGLCSRNEADEFLKLGLVLVNGKVRVPYEKLTELFLKVVRANKNYYLYCILWPPAAAQPNKGRPSASKTPSKQTFVPYVIHYQR